MKKITIRKASEKDFSALLELNREFFLWMAEFDSFLNKDYARFGMPQSVGKSIRSKKTTYFIAFAEGLPVGYCQVVLKKTQKWEKYRKIGYVQNLYVRKEYRKIGAGRKLMDESINFLKPRSDYIQILVHTVNKRAENLYKSLGFKEHLKDLRIILNPKVKHG